MTDPARRIAFEVLFAFENSGGRLDQIIEATTTVATIPDERDRKFISEMVYGVTRWRRSLDLIIASYSDTPIKKIDTQVKTLLRLGLYQALGMSRVPVSAAVNETVTLSRADKKARYFSKFINAILRKAVADVKTGEASVPEIVAGLHAGNKLDATTRIGEELSFPDWMIRRWIKSFGETKAREIAESSNKRAPTFLRHNRLKCSEEDFIKTLEADDITVTKLRFVNNGYQVTEGKITPSSEAIILGYTQPQDASSQIAAMLLDCKPGDTMADFGCGNGIKSGAFAEAMKNRGAIFAFDLSYRKLIAMGENMKRLGVDITHCAVADLTAQAPLGVRFSKIFVDAPCSATGVIRRHPESKWNRTEEIIARMVDVQRKMITRAFEALNAGGELVYAVCSIEPDEGFYQVENFLANTPGAERINIGKEWPELDRFISDAGDFFVSPGDCDMDGFYAAKIIKR